MGNLEGSIKTVWWKHFANCNSWYLHEEAANEGFTDIDIVVFRGKFCGGTLQIETIHYAGELLSYIVSRFHWAVVNKIVIAPLLTI